MGIGMELIVYQTTGTLIRGIFEEIHIHEKQTATDLVFLTTLPL